jgi:hypothetical protein
VTLAPAGVAILNLAKGVSCGYRDFVLISPADQNVAGGACQSPPPRISASFRLACRGNFRDNSLRGGVAGAWAAAP